MSSLFQGFLKKMKGGVKMKSKKLSYNKILVLFSIVVVLVLITGCNGGAPPIVNIFSADPSTINPGESSTLTWSVSDADTVTITPVVGTVDSSGSTSVSPVVTTDYILTATNSAGSVTASATVNVGQALSPVHNLTKNTYYNTIQVALDDADSNNTIEVSDGTYDESITFPSGKKIILQSINGRSSTIIRGNAGSSTVTLVNSLNGTTLEGFTITHKSGNNGRGIYIHNSNININNCTIYDNSTALGGGGIQNYDSTLTITGSTISGNSANYGGGINNYDSSLTITGSTISGNSTYNNSGGGICNDKNSSLTITGSTISGNSAALRGGGIGNYGDSSLTITGGTISGNSAEYSGGGINNYDSSLTITGGTISNNYSYNNGGGIYIWSNSRTISIGGISASMKNTICGNYKSGDDPSQDQQIRGESGDHYDTYKDTNYISAYCGGETYTLTTSVSPSGSGSVSPSGGTYAAGTSVTLTATPATDYKFDHWGGDAGGTSTSTTITMDSNKSVVAYFKGITYILTTSVSPSGSGYVTPSSGSYAAGTVVTLTATPNPNASRKYEYDYDFDSWGGDAGGTSTSTSITMNSNKSVTANFVRNYWERRALLVGVGDYMYIGPDLNAPPYDMMMMDSTLEYSEFGSAHRHFSHITLLSDTVATRQNILSGISSTFSAADYNDVSYFYFSGHGMVGYLLPTDSLTDSMSNDISVDKLENALDPIPGYKVVLLDCCYSGKFIGKSPEEVTSFDLALFNEKVIDVFSNNISRENLAHDDDEFQVLTACTQYQLSSEFFGGGIDPYGLFSKTLCQGIGYDDWFLADSDIEGNGDTQVSLHEAHFYVVYNIEGNIPPPYVLEQDIRIHPWGSEFVIADN